MLGLGFGQIAYGFNSLWRMPKTYTLHSHQSEQNPMLGSHKRPSVLNRILCIIILIKLYPWVEESSARTNGLQYVNIVPVEYLHWSLRYLVMYVEDVKQSDSSAHVMLAYVTTASLYIRP